MTEWKQEIEIPPILSHKNHEAPSVFTPAALLREARRQKNIASDTVPEICILDPDGDILRHLRATGRAAPLPHWACYHTELRGFEQEGVSFGIIGCAVGAAFAVLVAEELFASGCRLLISVTSAGQIAAVGPTPYFVLIDHALRDEGTSHHYLPPSLFAEADPGLVNRAWPALAALPVAVHRGATWTTDAPYRETEDAIAAARSQGALAVEMEAAALYAFARACSRRVLCFAHVTNQMAVVKGDFEKGEADGARDSLDIITTAAHACGFD